MWSRWNAIFCKLSLSDLCKYTVLYSSCCVVFRALLEGFIITGPTWGAIYSYKRNGSLAMPLNI